MRTGAATGVVLAAGAVAWWWWSGQVQVLHEEPRDVPTELVSGQPRPEDSGSSSALGTGVEPAPIEPSVVGIVLIAGRPTSATVHIGSEQVRANGSGRFAWGGVSAAPLSVWAERGWARSARVQLTPNPEQPAQVALELFDVVPVLGRVYGGPERRPVEGARVQFATTTGQVVVTDAEGAYIAEDVVPGLNEVRVDGAAPWEPVQRTVKITPGRQNVVDLPLELERVIEGHVRDAEGTPIAAATVHLERAGGPSQQVQSGGDGTFRFRHLERAPYRLQGEKGANRSQLLSTGPTSDITLTLGAGATLDVIVSRASASPAGLECALTSDARPPRDERTAVADAKGAAHFEGLVPGARIVWGRVPGRRWHWLGHAFLKPGANALSAKFEDDGRRVSVRAIDAVDYHPLAGAVVSMGGVTQSTDESGTTTFDDVNVAGDEHHFDSSEVSEIIATAKGYAGGRAWSWPGRSRFSVSLQPWRVLHGEVVGSDGTAIPRLQIDAKQVITGEAGSFELKIPASDLKGYATFGCPWCEPTTVTLPAGRVDLAVGRLVLQVGGTLEVTVTTSDGRPAPFATVVMRTEQGEPRWLTKREREGPSFMVDDNGQASIQVDPRRRWLVATRGGDAPSDHDCCDAAVAAGQTGRVSLQLGEAAFVEGSVVWRGVGVAGIIVTDAEEGSLTVTDGWGKYRLGPLTPGDHTVRTSSSLGKSIGLRGGQTRTVDFTQGTRLVVEWAEPLASPFVVRALRGRIDVGQFRYKDLFAAAWSIEASGPEATFDPIPAGEWTVVTLQRNEWRSAFVTIPEDGQVRVRLGGEP